MQHNSFEHIAKSHVVVFGERLENFEDSFLHADAGLHAFDFELGIV